MTQTTRYSSESILSGTNTLFLKDLLNAYRLNSEDVDPSWRMFFDQFGDDIETELITFPESRQRNVKKNQAQAAPTDTLLSLRALMMIRAFRVCGHLGANLDPLNIEKPKYYPELDPSRYGFDESDMDIEVQLDNVLGLESSTIRVILGKLEQIYCGNIGFEFMHIQNAQQKAWLQMRIEGGLEKASNHDKKETLIQLMRAESFERFLHVKYPGAKRFGIEGGESVLAALETLLTRLVTMHSAEELVFGMSHRGRLCVLTNFMDQPMRYVFAQFKGADLTNSVNDYSSGDVKYHQGYSSDRTVDGKRVHLSLSANPSHLEAVDPVTLGKVRSKQYMSGDVERHKTVGLLMHGDAAFAGQGLVAETLELSALEGYETGGTIHIIINNQIGFTTSPPMSRSSPYSSDLAKIIQAPIFHINGDDPDAVVAITKLAVDFQQTFKRDVVIDLVCYRRHGHNEGDEPMFTQPLMYKAIAEHPSVATQYQQKLLHAGILSEAESKTMTEAIQQVLNEEFVLGIKLAEDAGEERVEPDWLKGKWTGIRSFHQTNPTERNISTGVNVAKLIPLIQKSMALPVGFSMNTKLKRLVDQRLSMLETESPLDWGMGEIMAFASLLDEGHHVRLSGQDSRRGTFSHRHAFWIDQVTEQSHIHLNHLRKGQGYFEAVDSPLAEASVLGFEYGYSLAAPNSLVMWEAQFGDFANGAQVMVDQFIATSEAKWHRLSGLVMLLPHGFEGQGPEHSSARPERYLQMCAHNNWRVMNCTTPANLFHALRGQIVHSFRKPLVIMTPKSLLRHKNATSALDEFDEGTYLQKVIEDTPENMKRARRFVFCTGKVYYDLLEKRKELDIQDVALIRIEQLYPFPYLEIETVSRKNLNVEIVWCQEEPMNMGAWTFIDRRLEKALYATKAHHHRPHYAGRGEAAVPAAGHMKRHLDEQEKLMLDALVNPVKTVHWV
ncbi:MAG: 2-oxoglutarate dehydrogenase E1 component [Pseudomonadota bacterium]